MAGKAGKAARTVMALALFAVGYWINFMCMAVRVGSSREIYFLIFMLGYGVVYLSCWLIALFAAYKRNAKKRLNRFLIFWALTMTVFAFFTYAEFAIFDFLGFVLFVPLAGFDGLVFYLNNGYLYAENINTALVISIVMFLLCALSRAVFKMKNEA